MTSLKEVAAILADPRARLNVKGYVRSDGSVWNLVVTRLDGGATGYTELLRSAVGKLQHEGVAMPSGISVEEWNAGVGEQRDAWLKHLHDNGGRLSFANERSTMNYGAYEQFTANPEDGLVIRHCMTERVHVSGPDGVAKSPKARAKQYLRTALGVEGYEGKLIFTNGKFQDITRA